MLKILNCLILNSDNVIIFKFRKTKFDSKDNFANTGGVAYKDLQGIFGGKIGQATR